MQSLPSLIGSSTYWLSYAPFSFTHPFLTFTRKTPTSHTGSSPKACVSVNSSAYPLVRYVQHGASHVYYNQTVLQTRKQPQHQVQTHVSSTSHPCRIQTWIIGSQKLGFRLTPWLSN
eukprot:15227713-Ditylum_brightwellii.AAC.1